ncbi:MAG TPA: sodium-dependent transporter [Steroidobacteraceae bacterium]|nr:sodium-dependent transporter [Steroidobacteraceae bacterium]
MRTEANATPHWSSQVAVYLGTIGAAVGLGSIWRFPYLAGTLGGGTFIGVFILACLVIAIPLLIAEYMIGRYSGLAPTDAAGAMAVSLGGSRRWNIIGQLGTTATFLITSYYTIVAGWVVAYAWKCGTGALAGLSRPGLQREWQRFTADPWQLMGWQVLFLGSVAFISARGLGPGIELASRIRAPVLLLLLLVLDAYSLATGDVAQTFRFVFAPHWKMLSAHVVLAAIGQAFYATGVGMAMMLAYGSYMARRAPLVRPALLVSGSILLVSLLATVLVFPLVFRFHMDPAGGPALVFDVLPTTFALMPGGRLIGTVFFLLLIFAALTPSLAGIEPVVAWLQARGMRRAPAAAAAALAVWLAGVGSVLSFNVLAGWRPLEWMPILAGKTVFEVVDFVSSNVLLPLGALLTCVFVGWRLDRASFAAELGGATALTARVCRILLRYVCPIAIAAVLVAALLTTGAAAAGAPVTPLQMRAQAVVARLHGEITSPGLRAPVRVQRDRWGVPHIYAKNQHDLFFAQGFVVAQDRLFQMELWKRSGQGRLAEILGPSAVERDINARRLRYRGDMDAEFKSYAPDAKSILEAFTAGINAYIDAVQRPGGPGIPLEFQIAGFNPEHWLPEDCLNRLAAYAMTGNATAELRHAELASLVGPRKATELFDFDPAVVLDPPPDANYAGLSAELLKNIVSSDRRVPFGPLPLRESNNWTVAGSLTASGKPLLANDPHRVIAEPSLRYVVHLVAPGWNVIGAGEPGLPGVAAGHNGHIAWGFTIFGLDQQDLYLEKLDPAAPDTYATPKGWQPMETRTEIIRVRDAQPVEVRLKFTRHGPVLWEDGARALALRWVGAEPGTAGYLGSLALDRAENWRQFESAMERWKVPSENIVYADRRGNIGEHSTGLAPWRKNWTGLLPVPGDGQYEWSGFVPNAELPHSLNPVAGFIATANQKMTPDDYGYAVGYEWTSPARYLRAKELLEQAKDARRKLTVADMEAFQTDVVSLPARALQSLLRIALADASAGAPDNQNPAVNLMLDWDCALRADSAAAALYEIWAAELRKRVSALIVPESARAALGELPLQRVIHEMTQARASVFGSMPAQSRDSALLDALQSARARLALLQGTDVQRWSWGQLHQVRFLHPLDQAAGAADLLDRGPVQRPGDEDVLQATGFEGDSFAQVDGASYREIFDLANWDESRAINVPGQSGQPQSKHYDDLLAMWSEGRYFPLVYSRSAVDRATTDTMQLVPHAAR